MGKTKEQVETLEQPDVEENEHDTTWFESDEFNEDDVLLMEGYY